MVDSSGSITMSRISLRGSLSNSSEPMSVRIQAIPSAGRKESSLAREAYGTPLFWVSRQPYAMARIGVFSRSPSATRTEPPQSELS